MASGTPHQIAIEKQETSAMGRFQAVEFTLTADQYTIIQHFLPTTFVLLERKNNKREKGSSHKFIDEMSKFSGGLDNVDQTEGRSKRARIKKIDRYLQDDAPRTIKRNEDKFTGDQEMSNCARIIGLLKKHPHASPFLEPVDSKKTGASHYFDIIKEPMDFTTIQKNLRQGQYQSATQFHADISKVWSNSYAYNQKGSRIHKMTMEMEKYYRKISSENPKRQPKTKNKTGPKSIDQHQVIDIEGKNEQFDENEGEKYSQENEL